MFNFSCIYFKPTGRRFHILNECSSIWPSCAVTRYRFNFGTEKHVFKMYLYRCAEVVTIVTIHCPHYNDSNGFSWNSLRKYIENKCYYLCLLCFTLPWWPIVKGQTEKTNRTDIKFLGTVEVSKRQVLVSGNLLSLKLKVCLKKLKTGWSLNNKRSFITSNFVSSVNLRRRWQQWLIRVSTKTVNFLQIKTILSSLRSTICFAFISMLFHLVHCKTHTEKCCPNHGC